MTAGGMATDVPVALIAFNRPKTTAQVLRAVAVARPRQLLLITDGPRPGHAQDLERCAEVRRVLQSGVNWPCEILTHHAETNLGCCRRIATGVDWVFDQVSEAIVLEDDCEPHPDFFAFVRAMLDKYRDDPAVMHINGTNLRRQTTGASHFFSAYNLPWGWATWKRAWSHYRVNMTAFDGFVRGGGIEHRFRHSRQRKYFHEQYLAHCNPATNSWDWQWIFATWVRDGLAVTPAVNLISNIGDGADALHCTNHPFCHLPVHDWTDSAASAPKVANRDYDRFVFEDYFAGGCIHGWKGLGNAWVDRFHAMRIRVGLRSRFRRFSNRLAGGEGTKGC